MNHRLYNQYLHYDLTPEDHLSPNGTKERVRDENDAHDMADASNDLRTEIAHKNQIRSKLSKVIGSHEWSWGAYSPEEREKILASMKEQTKEITDLERRADTKEEEAALETELGFHDSRDDAA